MLIVPTRLLLVSPVGNCLKPASPKEIQKLRNGYLEYVHDDVLENVLFLQYDILAVIRERKGKKRERDRFVGPAGLTP